MKLTEIRPCDHCGGPISPMFHVLSCDVGGVNPKKTARAIAAAELCGSFRLAEAIGMTEDPIVLASDDPATAPLAHRLFLCNDCFAKPICLYDVSAKVVAKKEAKGNG